MILITYEVNFHALSRYATKLMTTLYERIHVFVNGFHSELEVLFAYMTYADKSFNSVIDFVKRIEGFWCDGQAAMNPMNIDNFHGS